METHEIKVDVIFAYNLYILCFLAQWLVHYATILWIQHTLQDSTNFTRPFITSWSTKWGTNALGKINSWDLMSDWPMDWKVYHIANQTLSKVKLRNAPIILHLVVKFKFFPPYLIRKFNIFAYVKRNKLYLRC